MAEQHINESNVKLADTLWNLNEGRQINPPPIAPEDNWEPQLALGIQATIGTCWWVATFMFYVKNSTSDADLTGLNGGTIFPIGWFWERIAEPNGIYNYFALGLMFNFVFYLLVSVVEFVAWMFYLSNTDIFFAAWWFSTIGYYGSIVGLALPWIFMAVYIQQQLESKIDVFPGTWAVIVMVMTISMWLAFAVLHILYVPDFMLHIAALPKPPCVCNLPFVDPASEKDSEEKKATIKAAVAEREYLCNYQCPAAQGECPLDKEEGQSYAEYKAACAALKDSAKGEEEAPLEALPEEDEEDLEEDEDDEEDFEDGEEEDEESDIAF